MNISSLFDAKMKRKIAAAEADAAADTATNAGGSNGKPNKRHRTKLVVGISAAAAAVAVAVGVGVATATAATSGAEYPSHVIETVSPSGTTINLFDYWITSQTSYSSLTGDSSGINAGHQLKFNTGGGTGINGWTGNTSWGSNYGMPLSFVSKTLVDGYPQIAAGTYSGGWTSSATYTDESLAYLFDDSTVTGKKAYTNVAGLLKYENGYYVYDATANFAVFNSTANAFDVYELPAVHKSTASGTVGEFFPFNSASTVFSNSGASANTITDGSTSLNHHFGLSMSTSFVQPANGKVTYNGTTSPMTFEFSGDDDVWVYIDGVLVGDLGGIHDSDSLSIDFSTGAVTIYNTSAGTSDSRTKTTTLKACYEAAGVSTTDFDSDTYAAGTSHELKFFYLERGAGGSNMKIKYNLYNQPTSEVNKVDQNGNTVSGAQFSLYYADGNYTYNADTDLLATGTTDSQGKLIFTKADGSIVSFDDEHDAGHDHYVLVETSLPDGYHTSLNYTDSEIHMDYTESAASTSTGGVLTSPDQTVTGSTAAVNTQWLNSAYLSAKETLTLGATATYKYTGGTFNTNEGLTFAVVMKNMAVGEKESSTTKNDWKAVIGTASTGYTFASDFGAAGAIEAAKANGYGIFSVGSTGEYMTELTEMPGDITKYAGMMSDDEVADGKAEYGVVIYHTTATSLDDATEDNTQMVTATDAKRVFGSVSNITNVKNRLWVQKVDKDGNGVEGATFALYTSDSVNVNAEGSYSIKQGAQPYDTLTTKSGDSIYGLAGAAAFPDDSDSHKVLTAGVYYLVETSAPDGYKVNSTISRVVVNDSGVFADAGELNDGVKSMVGPGALLYTLDQFGDSAIDVTLNKIKGTLQTGTLDSTDATATVTWNDIDETSATWLSSQYSADATGVGSQLIYTTENGELPILYSDTGISRMLLRQDATSEIADAGTWLQDVELNALFTNSSGLQYTDEKIDRLEVTKEVTADEGLTAPTTDEDGNDLKYTFKFTLPTNGVLGTTVFNSMSYEAVVYNADGTQDATYSIKSGDTISIKAGQTIRVYDLQDGDAYSVQEVTSDSTYPSGYKLTGRKYGDTELTDEGDTISGTIAATENEKVASDNKLVFTNNYSATQVTLNSKNGLYAQKTLNGRDWTDGDSFTFRLRATSGTPMPADSQVDGASVYKDITVTSADKSYFGDIDYTRPGTYTYSITEVTGDIDGISYSGASYTVKVVVKDDGKGALYIDEDGVTMTEDRTDAGEDVQATPNDATAAFSNSWDEYQASVNFAATKTITSYGSDYAIVADDYTFSLEPVGGYNSATATVSIDGWTEVAAADVPMPAGTTDSSTATNTDSGAVTFSAIDLTAKANAGHTYVYKMTEVEPDAADAKAGMSYDDSTYYAVIRAAWNNQGITTSVEYYKVTASGTGLQNLTRVTDGETPVFDNVYTPDSVNAGPIVGQKTLTGRSWTDEDSFTFHLAAADATTRNAINNGDITGWNDSTSTTEVSGQGGTAAGTAVDFEFATDVEDNKLTFTKPGTYKFSVYEDRTTGDVVNGVTCDTHSGVATFEVTDNQTTGQLEVSVTYNNDRAMTTDDAAVTDKAAFTNSYAAAGTFAGVDVSKVMEGKDLAADKYNFTVTALAYNGVTKNVPEGEDSLTNPAAKENEKAHLTNADGNMLLSFDFDETDLGNTYVYRISEVTKAEAGYTQDINNTGDAFVLIAPYADDTQKNDDGSSKIYARVTILKGDKVSKVYDTRDTEAYADANVFDSDAISSLEADTENVYSQEIDTGYSTITPNVTFTNKYSATLDYEALGGFNLIKHVLNGDENTIGSPSSAFMIRIMPIATDNAEKPELSTTAQEVADKLSIDVSGRNFSTGTISGYYDENASTHSATTGYWERNVLDTISTLKFDQHDNGKTYRLTYQELKPSDAGDDSPWTYDTDVYTIAVTFHDDGDGTMSAETEVTDPEGNSLGKWTYYSDQTDQEVPQGIIENTYTAKSPADPKVTPTIQKMVVGQTTDRTFTFDLVAGDDATKAAIDDGYIKGSGMTSANGYKESASTEGTLTDGQDKDVSFSEMSFYKVGTYTFKVTEETPEAMTDWTYDTHECTITVTVRDDNGTLVTTTTYSTDNGGKRFTNNYKTSVSYDQTGGLDIVKTLNGREQAANLFNFQIEAVDDNAKKKLAETLTVGNEAATTTTTTTTSVSRTAVLGDLTFSTSDKDSDFTFKISEKNEAKAGYTYDTNYWLVTITPKSADGGATLYTQTTVAEYDAQGNLIEGTTKTFNGDETALASDTAEVGFTNSYNASGEFGGNTAVKLNATKTITGTGAAEGEYTFKLYVTGTDPVTGEAKTSREVNSQTVTAKPGEAVSINFSRIGIVLDGSITTDQMALTTLVQYGYATRQYNTDGTVEYRLNFQVAEDLTSLPEGVRPDRAQPVRIATLKITDDGKGNLTPEVQYAEGVTSLDFTNIQEKVKTIGTVDEPSVDIDGQLLSVGSEYVYTINWTNNAVDENGNMTAANVTVTDELPNGLELIETGTTAGYVQEGNAISWNLGQQSANAHGSVTLRVRVTSEAIYNVQDGDTVATLTNTATITVADHNPYTGTTTNYVPVKSNDYASTVKLGDTITYTVSYKNTSDAAADIYITDTVPAGTDFEAFGDDDASSKGVNTDGALTWKLEGVAAGEQGTVTFTAKVNESALSLDSISNTATVKVGENGPEVSTNTVTSRASTTNLTAYKSVQTPVSVGDLITLRAHYFNAYEYDKASYTVTFDGNGGKMTWHDADLDDDLTGTTIDAHTIAGNTIAAPSFTSVPGGMKFAYWAYNGEKFDIGHSPIVEDITLTAVWVNESEKVPSGDGYKFETPKRDLTVETSVPAGTAFVSFGNDEVSETGTNADGKLTWTISNTAPADNGDVYFVVRVTDASFDIESMNTECSCTTPEAALSEGGTTRIDKVETGTLAVEGSSSTLVAPEDATFTFRLNVYASEGGSELVGTYTYRDDQYTTHQIKSGGTFTLKDQQGITLTGLPSGAYWTITEVDVDGNAMEEGRRYDGFAVETNPQSDTLGDSWSAASVEFTNVYTVDSVTLTGADNFKVSKALSGRDWTGDDSFVAVMTAEDNAPMPEGTTNDVAKVTLTKDAQSGSFGDITYTAPGTYTYHVVELSASEAAAEAGQSDISSSADGMHFSLARYTVVVTVTDDGKGVLSATSKMTQEADDNGGLVDKAVTEAAFANTYTKQKTIGTADNPTTDIDGQVIGVGGEYTYTINWENNTGAQANVSISDALPAGTEYVSSSNDGAYDEATKTVYWNLGEKAALTTGSVTVTVKVTEDAADYDAISNQATIQVGNHQSTTNATTNSVPVKSVEGTADDGSAKVGDTLTYTIKFTTDETESVRVTDKVPAGTTFVSLGTDEYSQVGDYDSTTGTVSWYISPVEKGTTLELSFKVRVTVDALQSEDVQGTITNRATVKLNGNPEIETNKVETGVKSGALKLTKTVTVAREGLEVDNDTEFKFYINLTDSNGKAISGTFGEGDNAVTFDEWGDAYVYLKNGESVEITGLPEGAQYEIWETHYNAYSHNYKETKTSLAATASDELSETSGTLDATSLSAALSIMPAGIEYGSADFGIGDFGFGETTETDGGSGTIAADTLVTLAETNKFDPFGESITMPTFNKVLESRTPGLQSGEFTFKLRVYDANGNQVKIYDYYGDVIGDELSTTNDASGKIKFDDFYFVLPGTYTVKVTEEVPDAADPQITYSENVYEIPVTVVQTAKGVETTAGTPSGSTTFTNKFAEKTSTKTVSKVVDGVTTDVNGKMVGVGDTLTYTVNWANNAIDSTTGASVPADIVVTDKVPEGTELVEGSITGNGVYNATTGTITWTLGNQEAGATGTVTFDVKVAASAATVDLVENQATVKVGENDTYTNTVVVNVPKKTVADASGTEVTTTKVGDTLTYSVTVCNQTAADENIYGITDPLCEGLTYVEGSADNGGTYDATTRTVSWPGFTLSPGETKTVTFKATVNANAVQKDAVSNTAKVQVNDDPVIDSNTKDLEVHTGSVAVSKTVTAREGLDVDNDKAFDFTIELKDTAGNAISGTFGEGDASVTFTDGKANFSLKNGESKTISGLPEGASYTVTEAAETGYSTTSTGAVGSVTKDQTATAAFTNNFDPSATTVSLPTFTKVLEGNRTVALRAGEFAFKLQVLDARGQQVGSDVTASNAADGTVRFDDVAFSNPGAYTVKVTEVVPEASDPQLTYSTNSYELPVTVEQTAEGLKATAGTATGSTTFTNAFAEKTSTKTVSKVVDGVTTDVDGQTVGVGDELTYTVNWANNATDAATGASVAADVTVTDAIPAGTELVEGSVTGDGAYDATAGIITWSLGSQAAGATGSVSFRVRVSESAYQKVENAATVKVGQNSSQTNKTVVDIPVKQVEGASNGSARVGDTLTYKVTVTNSTDAVATYEISDPLSSGLTYVEGTASDGGSYSEATNTVSWAKFTLAAGESKTVSFSATVNAKAVQGAVANTAEVRVNDGPAVKSNPTDVTVNTGSLEVAKTVHAREGLDVDDDKAFDFTVELKDTAGNAISGTFGEGDSAVTFADGKATFSLKNGESKTVSGLPEGASYTVTEASAAGYETTSANATGTISKDASAKAAFNNYFNPSDAKVSVPALTKVLEGREPGLQEGEFTFKLQVVDSEGQQVGDDVTASNAADGSVKFNDVAFSNPGAYTVKVTEVVPESADPQVTYSTNSYELPVTVEQTAEGLVATAGEAKGSTTFTNTFAEKTSTKTVSKVVDGVTTDVDGQTVGVGDELTYTVNWANNAIDDKGTSVAAKVSVSDLIPAGTTYVEGSVSDGGTFNAEDSTVTWDLGEQAAGATGTVSFKVKVTEDAATVDAVTNTAQVKVGENTSSTNTVTVNIPKKVVKGAGETGAKVGDTLTYSVTVTNATDAAATYQISDPLSDGLTYELNSASDQGSYEATTRTVSWKLEVAAGESKTVTFKATVNDKALALDSVANTAEVKVNDGPVIKSNPSDVTIDKGGIKITKTLDGGDPAREFEFTVDLVDKTGNPVSGTFGEGDGAVTFTNGRATISLAGGSEKCIEGLPVDATFTVTETAADGYTAYVSENGTWTKKSAISGTVSEDQTVVVDYKNVYGESSNINFSTDDLFSKTLTGRDWQSGDAFSFTITADAEGTPLPENVTADVNSATAKAGEKVGFGFGNIAFSTADLEDAEWKVVDGKRVRTKDFTYTIEETIPEEDQQAAGVTYTTRKAKLTITVTDDGTGNLSGEGAIVANVQNGNFTNSYSSELDYSAAGGISLTKVLTGHAMAADQFEWTLAPADKDSAALLGMTEGQTMTYQSGAKAAGQIDTIDLLANKDIKFTQADAGKTFTYTLEETKLGGNGYTNDTAKRTITIAVEDNNDGTITATTTVATEGKTDPEVYTYTTGEKAEQAVVVAFNNSYSAHGELGGDSNVKVKATKVLTGRNLVDGEFEFQLVNSETGDVVATGTNDVDGNISFDKVTYTEADAGKTYGYYVREVTDGLEEAGITPVVSESYVIVSVTDNNDGTLGVTVFYPEGSEDGLVFKNVYGADAVVELPMSGTKTYDMDEKLEATAPSIEGQFSFTLTGEDGAPMPEGAEGRTMTVQNHNGTVDFGSINYTMENVFGESDDDDSAYATRAMTFNYTVEETGGKVAGVSTDGRTVKIEVTVVDNGDGTLSAFTMVDGKDVENGALKFDFTNTYSVTPVSYSVTDEGGIKVSKSIEGRELAEGEFSFHLVDAEGSVVAAGVNDADGNVKMTSVSYAEPGVYDYQLVEASGQDGTDGVTFDHNVYNVRVTVTDNGAGQLVAEGVLLGDNNEVVEGGTIEFKNSYTTNDAEVQLVASKKLAGGTMTEGQFSFELVDSEGNVVQTKSNGAVTDGSAKVVFDALTFTSQDAGKTFTYKVREVNDGQDNVTYDTDVREVNITVTDNGKGELTATVEGMEGLAFTNVYTTPTPEPEPEPQPEPTPEPEPEPEPEQEKKPVTPNTGDMTSVAGIGALAAAGVVVLLASRKKREE